ncbi:hypothetical protein PHPALM_28439 [Phytophthora palmivora]|uniref:Uncharacterized protein n=1 Tax=Phytophthora palmivora TaxID=4796 RepID=A0A2P4XA32_9STRA|nr:hypothetical protein PHPALM_28439 [Phytophthora palmivora]
MKYHKWYNTRRVMAFTAMALSLDMNLRDLPDGGSSLLWGRTTAHFTKGDGVNLDYILRDLLNHELKVGQTVQSYVTKSEELVQCLRRANGEMEEWEHASLLVSNSQREFRELAEQHTVWCSKNDRRTPTRSEATRRLRQAEQADAVPRAAQVSDVYKKKSRQKRHGGKYDEVTKQKKACTRCSNCGIIGHCTE